MQIDWRWSLSETSQTIVCEHRTINSWTQEYTLHPDVPAEATLLAAGRAKRAWYLDAKRKLRQIRGTITPPFPVGNWLVIENDEGLFQIDLPKFPHLELSHDGKTFRLQFPIRSRSSTGLRLWGERKIGDTEKTLTLSRRIYRLGSLEEARWIEPYPEGARAVICLTDHADWDSTDKLEKLADLFDRCDFRFTKSIFPHSDPQGRKQEPGLDDPAFRKVIDRLYEMGTEIAYHGFSPRMMPPSFEAVKKRMALMREYKPVTWIDHGTGRYLFSRVGKCKNGMDLVELLGNEGIENYWSYTDIWKNPGPSGSLNLWTNRKAMESFSDVLSLFKKKNNISAKQLAYLLVSIPKNIFGGADYRKLKQFYKPKTLNFLREKKKKLRSLHSHPFGLYDKNGIFSFAGTPDKPLVFDTILLNHLSLQISPKAIEGLIKENGVLLAHCYMGAQHRYGGSNIFDNKDNILPEFEENIKYIDTLQKQKQVVSLSFQQLQDQMDYFNNVKILKIENNWIFEYTKGSQ